MWLDGIVFRAVDLQSKGREFGCFQVQSWASFHTRASVTEQHKLVQAYAGKVTIGLALHWPCIIHSSLST